MYMRVLITGTSTGIGLAAAIELGRAGHTVFATLRNPSRAPQLGEIAAREKLPVSVLSMDVDSDQSVREVVSELHRQGGALDVLINNAGIERMGSVEDLPLEAFRSVMETNYFGALRCIQAVAPKMRENGSGCIINVSSIAGKIAMSPMAAYTASKWAVEALSEALAQEMKPYNIRVAVVEPGIIDTPMARRIEASTETSLYPQTYRVPGMFQAVLSTPRPPSIVARKIREIVEGDDWTLRHPTGSDAAPFLAWRASMTDEAWVDWGAMDDEAWYARVEKEFGLDARGGQAKVDPAGG
jgi:NAD(P)-dependent dehydrogenase (short-subunit alcohol dehydrogenase family)